MSAALRTLLMRAQRPIRTLHLTRHCISTTSRNDKGAMSDSARALGPDALNILRDGTNHKVDNLEKRFLVWAGKYKTVEDVPPTVPQGMMEKARNKVRIKISNYMMLATILASLVYVYSGKQAAKRGESVQKMNLEWHRKINGETSTPTP